MLTLSVPLSVVLTKRSSHLKECAALTADLIVPKCGAPTVVQTRRLSPFLENAAALGVSQLTVPPHCMCLPPQVVVCGSDEKVATPPGECCPQCVPK